MTTKIKWAALCDVLHVHCAVDSIACLRVLSHHIEHVVGCTFQLTFARRCVCVRLCTNAFGLYGEQICACPVLNAMMSFYSVGEIRSIRKNQAAIVINFWNGTNKNVISGITNSVWMRYPRTHANGNTKNMFLLQTIFCWKNGKKYEYN